MVRLKKKTYGHVLKKGKKYVKEPPCYICTRAMKRTVCARCKSWLLQAPDMPIGMTLYIEQKPNGKHISRD
ncbi:MAG: hypothetical protein [Siphoviridae sp. ctvD11]|nr:MAG: hypothetical protein [Siphoviridae sp. ctvD11]